MLKNRFKKILVPLDGSPSSIRSLNEAISLARQCDSELIGIHVVPISPIFQEEKFKTFRNYKVKLGKRVLKQAKLSAARNGIELKDEILYDDNIKNAVSKFAKFKKCGVIVIGSRGKGDPKAKFLGSTAFGLLHISKIPILIVQ